MTATTATATMKMITTTITAIMQFITTIMLTTTPTTTTTTWTVARLRSKAAYGATSCSFSALATMIPASLSVFAFGLGVQDNLKQGVNV